MDLGPLLVAPFMHVVSRRREGRTVNAPNFRPGPYATPRRSQRILLSVSVVVSGKKPGGTLFAERTRTLVVNAHGGLVELREPVLVGQLLRIKNLATNEETDCKVVDINPSRNNLSEVGVEFREASAHFWRVAFPPSDWSVRSPEAKHLAFGTATPAAPSRVKK